MSITTITILILVAIIIYFVLMFFWMRYTFKYTNTLNFYIFKRSIESKKVDYMHYIELSMIILLGIAILTTIISQIQIWATKRR